MPFGVKFISTIKLIPRVKNISTIHIIQGEVYLHVSRIYLSF